MKTFYSGRKIFINPLLLINDKLKSDLKKKVHHFRGCSYEVNWQD